MKNMGIKAAIIHSLLRLIPLLLIRMVLHLPPIYTLLKLINMEKEGEEEEED